jgi:hypothetical protein
MKLCLTFSSASYDEDQTFRLSEITPTILRAILAMRETQMLCGDGNIDVGDDRPDLPLTGEAEFVAWVLMDLDDGSENFCKLSEWIKGHHDDASGSR